MLTIQGLGKLAVLNELQAGDTPEILDKNQSALREAANVLKIKQDAINFVNSRDKAGASYGDPQNALA